MFADYPFLSLVVTGYFMLLLSTIFAAFGWCDPNEYQKKIGLDVFGGVMTVLFWRYSGMILSIVEANVTPGKNMMDSLVGIGEALYNEIGFEKLLTSTGNDLLGLILIGVSIMLMCILYVTGGIFAIYFPFRMLLILDLYIDNIVRYILMGLALIGIIILGVTANEGLLTVLMVLFGIASIAALLIGNIRLYKAHKNPRRHTTAYTGTTARAAAVSGDVSSKGTVSRPVRSTGSKSPIGNYFKNFSTKMKKNNIKTKK